MCCHGVGEQPTSVITHGINLSENECRIASGKECTPGWGGVSDFLSVEEEDVMLTCS